MEDAICAAGAEQGVAEFCSWRGPVLAHWPIAEFSRRVGLPTVGVSRADLQGGTRADGGNTTAANRLLGALNWLAEQKPGIYDGLDVPMQSVLPPEMEATRWSD